MVLRDIPWKVVRKLYYKYRNAFFSVPRPDVVGIVVDKSCEELEVFFRKNHFDYQQLSYNYSGEDFNMYRPEYEDGALSDTTNYQLHVRGFEMVDGRTFLEVHYEPDPTEHPEPHLSEESLSWVEGRQKLRGLLSSRGVGHEVRKVDGSEIV